MSEHSLANEDPTGKIWSICGAATAEIFHFVNQKARPLFRVGDFFDSAKQAIDPRDDLTSTDDIVHHRVALFPASKNRYIIDSAQLDKWHQVFAWLNPDELSYLRRQAQQVEDGINESCGDAFVVNLDMEVLEGVLDMVWICERKEEDFVCRARYRAFALDDVEYGPEQARSIGFTAESSARLTERSERTTRLSNIRE